MEVPDILRGGVCVCERGVRSFLRVWFVLVQFGFCLGFFKDFNTTGRDYIWTWVARGFF